MNKKHEQGGQSTVKGNQNQNNAETIYHNKSIQHKEPKLVTQSLRYQRNSRQYVKPDQNGTESLKYWFISLGLYLAAFAVYVGVWAVQSFALNHAIASHYYQKGYNWADAMPYTYQNKVESNVKSIALELVLQWVMWKAPLVFFTYNCIKLNQGIVKWITLALVTAILLATDIVLTIYVHYVYNNMMYFGLFSILTVIVAMANNASVKRVKQALLDSLLPLLCIAILYTLQNVALPILYNVYINNLPAQAAMFLIFYAFPLIDIIMYALVLLMGSYISQQVRTFYQRIHYLLLGYEVGFIMLVGYTQVQFYYLCAYLIFRNLFSNWVMWRWDNVVKLPPLLSGWIVPYYFSYVLMFIPFGGIGNIVLSVGYYSMILVNTTTALYSYPSSLYPSSIYTPGTNPTDFELNINFKGQILWIAGIVLWVATTFSQRYSKKKPQIVNSIIYNLFGIYLFYLGLSAGITTLSLTKYSLIS